MGRIGDVWGTVQEVELSTVEKFLSGLQIGPVRIPPGEDFLLGLLRVVLASEFPDDSSCHRTVLPSARLDESKTSDLAGKRFFVLLKASLHRACLSTSSVP